MASQSITRMAEVADKALQYKKRIQEKAKISKTRMTTTAEVLVGAALAGAIDGKYPHLQTGRAEVAGIPATPAAGALLILLGLSEAIPYSEHAMALGVGMASGYAYGLGHQAVTK